MWRSNYHEDWERRKTYLIRSLFQDIPVLSPVPELQESRSGVGSPSDVPPSRSYSPLPPLIIERIPNRHDHSKKFYQDLEKKMKKLYKKLFHNEGSSSIEDLIDMYGGDYDASNLTYQIEDHCQDIGAGNFNASVSTIILDDNIAQRCRLSQSNEASSSNSSQGNHDVQTSPLSLCRTQLTTVVEVHIEPTNDHDETLRNLHQDINVSPILECHRIGYNKTLSQIEMNQEEGPEAEEDSAMNKVSGTETLGSTNEEDSKEEGLDQICSSEASHEIIEVMRKQREISPSLGSLQNEAIASFSSRCSSSYSNVELQKNVSLDLPEENVSIEDQPYFRETSFSSASVDFGNVLTTSTPKIIQQSKTKSSSEFSSTSKRVRSDSSVEDEEINSIMITKRRKCENIAIQTSLISESDAEDTNDWNQLKNNFFIGIPRIYKLCSCNDHACRDK